MQIIKKPIVTEKYTAQGETLNRYGFIVDVNANKIQIKKAIEELYGVTVEDVNTMRVRGKIKYRYTKSGVQKGRKNNFKKAIVTLAKNDSIDFYSNI
jgi:large subunit ribosomal protein L23